MRRSLPKGLLTLIIATSCFVTLLAAYVASNRLDDQTVSQYWAGTTSIAGDTSIDAGTAAEIVVTTDARDGTQVQLGIFAPISTIVIEGEAESGQTTFTVGGELTRHAGIYRLIAQVDEASTPLHTIEVRPLTAVDPVVPLIGPRTIIADGSDFTMTVVSPTDEFGNPVIDDTPVTIDLLRPSGERTLVVELVRRALAPILIESTTEVGRITVSASVGDADGPSNTIDQVAGTPAAFSVEVDARNALADGFTLHSVQTSELRDQFDNVLPDGVSAVFVVDDADGTSFIQSTVQGGIARALIEAPSSEGELVVSARVSGAQSVPLTVAFAQAVDTFQAQLSESSAGFEVTVGPVLTSRGGYVPDGTEVTLRNADGEVVAIAALRGGVAEINIEEPPAQLEASVLGSTMVVRRS